MKKSFDDILNECIRRLETSGGDIEAVLSRYPEQADELRPHLEVWASLSAVEKAQATPQGAMRGRQQLLTAIAGAEQKERGFSPINNLATKGGLSMKFLAMFVTGAALALGITFLTGNLEFGGGSTAQATPFEECLGILNFDGEGGTDLDDILAMKTAIETNDLAFDFNGDGTTDIFDLVLKLNEFAACLEVGGLATPPDL